MNDIEFAKAWPGVLHKVGFVPPRPLLPSRTTSFLYHAGLPKKLSISCNQIVTFEMLPSAEHLSKTWAERMREDCLMPFDWGRYWRIGDIICTQAAPWLCLEEVSGRVFAIDVDIDGPVYPVNESLLSLGLSMLHWLRWLSETGGNHFWLPRQTSACLCQCDAHSADEEGSTVKSTSFATTRNAPSE